MSSLIGNLSHLRGHECVPDYMFVIMRNRRMYLIQLPLVLMIVRRVIQVIKKLLSSALRREGDWGGREFTILFRRAVL